MGSYKLDRKVCCECLSRRYQNSSHSESSYGHTSLKLPLSSKNSFKLLLFPYIMPYNNNITDNSSSEQLDGIREHSMFTIDSVPVRENPQQLIKCAENSKFRTANAAPVGQIGYGIAALLSAVISLSGNSQASNDTMILLLILFFGGFAQLGTGLALLSSDIYAGVVFGMYGVHWSIMGFSSLLKGLKETSSVENAKVGQVIYTVAMFFVSIGFLIPTFRMNIMVSFVIGFIALSFMFSIAGIFEIPVSKTLAAVCGLWSGSCSLYLGIQNLVRQAFGKPILPVFPYKDQKDGNSEKTYVPEKSFHNPSMSPDDLRSVSYVDVTLYSI